MIYIVLGVIGFITIYLFDLVSIKRVPFGVKPCIWITGSGLLTYAVVMLCLKSNTLPFPLWSVWLGWGLLPIAVFLLVHSLFINLPFFKTYVATGVGGRLIKTGLYKLVRHPWVHCFILVLLSLVLISRSSLLLVAAPLWILLNITLTIIQDKFLFSRMFAGYDGYRRNTPMLIPSFRSIKAFINSFKHLKA